MTGILAVASLAASLGLGEPEKTRTQCRHDCAITDTGLALIRNFEGYSPFVYKDAAGLDTIGYGHLMRPGETFTQPLLPEEADKLLRKDVGVAERGVRRRATIHLLPGQFDALVSFTFNLGEGALQKSTLLKKVNAEKHAEVPSQFEKWVYAGGKKLRGLVLRRKAEAKLYASEE